MDVHFPQPYIKNILIGERGGREETPGTFHTQQHGKIVKYISKIIKKLTLWPLNIVIKETNLCFFQSLKF